MLRAADIQGNKRSKDKRYPGLEKYLVWLSSEYPVAFSTLLGKVLPMQVGGSTDDGINIQVVFTDTKI